MTGADPSISVVLALIHRKGRYFLQRRDLGSKVLPGLWEFPGGKVEYNESSLSTLLRELGEEIHWKPEHWKAMPAIEYAYPERRVVLHPFRCEGQKDPWTLLAWGWFTPKEMLRLPIPEANQSLVDRLANLEP